MPHLPNFKGLLAGLEYGSSDSYLRQNPDLVVRTCKPGQPDNEGLSLIKNLAIFSFLLLAPVLTALAETPVKIGVLTDLSGNGAYIGTQSRIGAILAQRELEQGGPQVELVFEDSAMNAVRGLSGAQKLLTIDKVDALYVDFNFVVVAISPLVEQNKTVMVYSSGAESVARKNGYAFKSYFDFSLGCELLAREFLKRGIKKIAVLKVEAEYGELCLRGAQKAVEVEEQSYRLGESVAPQILALKNKGVEAIINSCFEVDALNMLKAMSDINFSPLIGVNEDALTANIEALYSKQLDHGLAFGLQQPSSAILNDAKSLPGGEQLHTFERVGLSYLHIKQLAAAVAACRGASAGCLVDMLNKSGPDGSVGFEGWRDRIAQLHTILKEYKDKKLEPIGAQAGR